MSNYRGQWSEAHLAILLQGWGNPYMTVSKIAEAVDRSEFAVSSKAKADKLGRKATTYGDAWNEENEKLLRDLWAAGLSGGEIAKRIGGVSRNAVIGKAIRLGMKGRAEASKPARSIKAPHVARNTKQGMGYNFKRSTRAVKINAGNQAVDEPQPRPARVAPPKALAFLPLPNTPPVPILSLAESHCRWPIDMPNGEVWCCGRKKADKRYCDDHAKWSTGEGTPSERSAHLAAKRIAA